jgi:hypothetical protein
MMLRTLTTTICAYLLAAMTPLVAQTPAPSGAGTAGTAGAAGTAATGGMADWWWVILLVVVIGAAIWYFTSRRTRV